MHGELLRNSGLHGTNRDILISHFIIQIVTQSSIHCSTSLLFVTIYILFDHMDTMKTFRTSLIVKIFGAKVKTRETGKLF